MKVRDILSDTVCDIYITDEDDPTGNEPMVIIRASAPDTLAWFSDALLNAEVHLITVKDEAVFISLNYLFG